MVINYHRSCNKKKIYKVYIVVGGGWSAHENKNIVNRRGPWAEN